jgi:hypothetical protein
MTFGGSPSIFERVSGLGRGTMRVSHGIAGQALHNTRSIGPDIPLRRSQEHSLPEELRAMVRQAVAQVVAEQARSWRHDRLHGLNATVLSGGCCNGTVS